MTILQALLHYQTLFIHPNLVLNLFTKYSDLPKSQPTPGQINNIFTH